jgi:hypothetical protein
MKNRVQMRGLALFGIALGTFLAAASLPCLAQVFKPYPGSKLDEKGSRAASATNSGKQSDVYTTNDAFDKVYAFYKGLYQEYTMNGIPGLPSGVGGADSKDIRDITVIQTVRAK